MLRNTRKTRLFLPFLLLMTLFIGCQSATDTTQKIADGKLKMEVDKLFGKWQSVTNPKNIIELTTDRMRSFSGDLKLADESLVIYHDCIARCVPEGASPMPCLVTDGKQANNCFEVLELTDKKLSYALIGGDKKIFNFQKM